MSKILKNDSGSSIVINDTGVTIPNSTQYTIPPQDYLLWAASSDVVTEVGASNLVVNDGSTDLNISDGIDLIKGIFPTSVNIEGVDVDNNALQTHDIHNAHTAFGSLQVDQLKPYSQMRPIDGFDDRVTENFNAGTSSESIITLHNIGKEFTVKSGTSQGGYAVIRSRKTLSYRPGIGSLSRFTARYGSPVAGGIQRAGLFNIGNEITFGYDGDDPSLRFGILFRNGGRPEIRKMEITNTIGTQGQTIVPENITITLNGVAYVTEVTELGVNNNAAQIAYANNINAGGFSWSDLGWSAYNVDNTIYFQARSVGAKNGTYSVVGEDEFTATISSISAGKEVIDNWIYQDEWNKTTLSSVSDPFILDPTKGNVYQVQFQYLGYGAIKMYIEDPNDGRFQLVHTIKYANSNTNPSIDIPSYKTGIIAANTTNTTSVEVSTASMVSFHESNSDPDFKVNAFDADFQGLGTTLTNIISLQKTTINNGVFDISDAKMIQLTAAAEGTKPVILDVLLNPTFTDDPQWQNTNSTTNIRAATNGGVVSGGTLVYSVALSKSSSQVFDLSSLNQYLTNDDVLCIAARSTAGTTQVVASIIWESL